MTITSAATPSSPQSKISLAGRDFIHLAISRDPNSNWLPSSTAITVAIRTLHWGREAVVSEHFYFSQDRQGGTIKCLNSPLLLSFDYQDRGFGVGQNAVADAAE